MKKYRIIFSLSLFLITVSIGRSASFSDGQRSKSVPDSLYVSHLYNLNRICKVWGFLKYHDPRITANNINWDESLFEMLSEIARTDDDLAFKENLYVWVRNLGEVPEAVPITASENHSYWLKPDNQWILDTLFIGNKLSLLLRSIEPFGTQERNVYISFMEKYGFPTFNETPYEDADYSSPEFRLLTLFRYWNVINYYYPYKKLMDNKWDSVLVQYIPRFLSENTPEEFLLLVKQMAGEITDTHSTVSSQDMIQYNSYFYGSNYLPLRLEFIENHIVVSELLDTSLLSYDIQMGDILSEINGESTRDILEKREPYFRGSNRGATLNTILTTLLDSNKDTIELGLRRDQSLFKCKIPLKNIPQDWKQWVPPIPNDKLGYRLLEDSIGYLHMGRLTAEEFQGVTKKLEELEGLVIDLRCYPRAFNVYSDLKYFVPAESTCAVFYTNDQKMPGAFYDMPMNSQNHSTPVYTGKIVLLVNQSTISSAEFTAMCLQCAPHVITIGSQTAGADGNVARLSLPYGIVTSFTAVGVRYPDNTETQRMGIKIDQNVEPTIAGIKQGRDEVLEKALEMIRK